MINDACAPRSLAIGNRSAAWLLALLLPLFGSLSAPRAVAQDEISGSAGLSRSTVEQGSSVQLRITIEGTTDVDSPPPPSVDGLSIQFGGQSVRQNIINFERSSSVTLTYRITGEKVGKYQIPSITVTAGGQPMKTPELELEVTEPSKASRDAQRKLFFAELAIPKGTAYVGELIPVEIRFYYNRRIRFQPEQPPVLSGEGYTSQKLVEPQMDQEVVDGEAYNVITYKTAIAGVRPGTVEIGPITQNVLVSVPSRRGMPSLMDDLFGRDPFGRGFGMSMSTSRETVSTEKQELTIQALPEAGQPPEFQGAVGEFTMSSTIQPRQGETGQPISARFQIRGTGNFDRVTAPVVEENAIWREYDPTEQFKPDDDLGMRGVKTFELVMVPKEATNSMPGAKFVYFDPNKEVYITRETPPFPVEIVERPGAPAATPTPVVQKPTTPTPSPTPERDPNELMPIQVSLGDLVGPFDPAIKSRLYLAANIVPALLLLSLLIFGSVRSARSRNSEAIALRREKQKWYQQLRTAKNEQEGAQAFQRLLELELQPGAFESVTEKLEGQSQLSPEEIERSKALIHLHDRLQYTPGDPGQDWSAEDRDFCLALLRKLTNPVATKKAPEEVNP